MPPESKTPENFTAWKPETSEKIRENETIDLFLRLADNYYAIQNLLKKSEGVIANTTADGRKIKNKEYDLLKITRTETTVQAKLMLGKVESAITALFKPSFALDKIYAHRLGKPISSLAAAEAEAAAIGNELYDDFIDVRRGLSEEITEKNKDRIAVKKIMNGENWFVCLEKLKILPGQYRHDSKVSRAFKLSLLSRGETDEDNAVVLLKSFEPAELTPAEQRFSLLEIEDLTGKDFEKWGKIIKDAEKTIGEAALLKDVEINSPTTETEVRKFSFNEQEAKRLGLEPIHLEAYPQADQLIQQIINKTINISTPEGKNIFAEQWKRDCPNLPMPAVPEKNDWWYLTKLSEGKIVSSLTDNTKTATPQFGKEEFLLIDNWKEKDYNVADAKTAHASSLLRELLGGKADQISTVNIKREIIDAVLWDGDPADRKPAVKHAEILLKLGVDPNNYELRCISQDEYARGSVAKDWGKKELWTHFDNYFLGVDGGRYGLYGGDRDYCGPSRVDCAWRGDAGGDLAVRLVLSRKQK